MARCPVCGIDEDDLTLHDATDALRTYPRRYREALADVPDDQLRARPEGQAASMLELAATTREGLELLAAVLPSVLEGGEPSFPTLEPAPPGSRPGWAANTDLVDAGITTACAALVEQIEATPVAAWDRAFHIDGAPHSAIWIPRRAAHEGAHRLREIARVRAIVTAS